MLQCIAWLGPVAQRLEQGTHNPLVPGSNPGGPSLRSRRRGERGLSRRSFSVGGHRSPCIPERGELRLGKPHHMSGTFVYVYVLKSEVDKNRFYTGLTADLRERLSAHNHGRVRHTSKWKPWTLKAYIAFRDRGRAADFERYLKSSSGRAFVKKRL